jgi:hypothetical protein
MKPITAGQAKPTGSDPERVFAHHARISKWRGE